MKVDGATKAFLKASQLFQPDSNVFQRGRLLAAVQTSGGGKERLVAARAISKELAGLAHLIDRRRIGREQSFLPLLNALQLSLSERHSQ